MSFPDYFSDAESDFDKADFVIFGIPFEKSSTFRHGSNKAPQEIRQASWNFETYDLRTGLDLKEVKMHDYGNIEIDALDSQAVIETVSNFVSELLNKKKFPIGIGGEHSISTGIIKAFPKDIAVLSLDAHLDFREEYENDINNHACTLRRIADHVNIKNIALLGFRSADKEEYLNSQNKGLLLIDSFSIYEKGICWAINETKNFFKNKNIYLTLDIDVIDPAYAPGASTPEPFGINPFDVIEIIDAFSPQLVGFDIMEVCPSYDHGETSLLSAKLIRNVINLVSRNNLKPVKK
jgi:agmatinase